MGIKKIIAFESDHNWGKGSQIEKINQLAKTLNLEVITTRWAIYREGSGKNKGDPESSFWKQKMKDYPLVDNMSTEERFIFEKENAIRLRRELNIAVHRLLANTQKDILLILDRSEISWYFWLKKLFSSLSFEEYLNLSKNENAKINIIKPDITFVLQVRKEELLKRNAKRWEKNTSRNQERENNITHYHQLFEDTIKEVESFFSIHYLDWERPPEEIFQDIQKKLQEIWLL